MKIDIAEINIAVQAHLNKVYGGGLTTSPIMYDSEELEKNCGFYVVENIMTNNGESEYRRLEVRIADNGEYPRKKRNKI